MPDGSPRTRLSPLDDDPMQGRLLSQTIGMQRDAMQACQCELDLRRSHGKWGPKCKIRGKNDVLAIKQFMHGLCRRGWCDSDLSFATLLGILVDGRRDPFCGPGPNAFDCPPKSCCLRRKMEGEKIQANSKTRCISHQSSFAVSLPLHLLHYEYKHHRSPTPPEPNALGASRASFASQLRVRHWLRHVRQLGLH